MKLDVVVPICVTRGLNAREHHMVRAKRVKAERIAVGMELLEADACDMDSRTTFYQELRRKPDLGARVSLLRPYARIPLDTDNLSGAFKGTRDEVAAFLGVDDKSERIHWRYVQCKARKVDGGARPRLSLGLDTHIRLRIEIVPASDVDPMATAVRILRRALEDRVDLGSDDVDEALATADALATFEPQEMYR